jgi:tetratricopeptide (TPR) repeat protein
MLGYTLVDRTNDHREGLELIERAQRQLPDNGAILDSMGWALHRLRRNTEALDFLERADRRSRDPEIVLHLGEVLWSLDRRADALNTLEQGLKTFPDNEKLQEAVRKRKK